MADRHEDTGAWKLRALAALQIADGREPVERGSPGYGALGATVTVETTSKPSNVAVILAVPGARA